MENEDDQVLLARWAGGDRAAGEALLDRLLPGIYGLCRRILRSEADAEEAAQETFARLCAEVRGRGKLLEVRRWAATVAMNLCFDRRRRNAREILADPPEPAEAPAEPLHPADLEKVREHLNSLPERYRLALHYHFAIGLKPREWAEAMGLEDGTARVLLHRAIAALRKKAGE